VDPVRDLGRIEPWQESLERSRARRAKSSGPAGESSEGRKPTNRRRAATRTARPRMLLAGAGGILAVASLVILLPGALAGRSGASLTAARGGDISASRHSGSDGAGPVSRWVVPRIAGMVPGVAGMVPGCQATSRPSHYVNPLARAHVKPERIDQGVDYAGSGTLAAIGAARLTYVASAGVGWPGSFIEYQLLDGAYAGCYVYYAEGVNPAVGLRVGQTVTAGQPIASIISGWATGIELGWGAGISTMTYAAKTQQWNATSDENSKASPAGRSFSALIASLGGPPGKVEG
jgi:murein DD-endopeptidase MepM/ murein hydrolase activator NlpD